MCHALLRVVVAVAKPKDFPLHFVVCAYATDTAKASTMRSPRQGYPLHDHDAYSLLSESRVMP